MPAYRPLVRIPRWLRDRVGEISGRDELDHNCGTIWHWTIAQAAADVQAALDGHPSHRLPPARGWWDDCPHAEVRWHQARVEAAEHQRLIEGPGGSSRIAVLSIAALSYVAVGGNLVALMRPRTPGDPWITDLPVRAKLAHLGVSG